MAMTLVSTVTVGAGGVNAILFDNIPQTGKDLYFVFSMRTGSSSDHQYTFIEINGVQTGPQYLARRLLGDGSGVGSQTDTNGNDRLMVNANTSTSNTFGSASIYFSNYTSSANKMYSGDMVTENNATLGRQNLTAGAWLNTSAITSINFSSAGTNYLQHSTISLYIIS